MRNLKFQNGVLGIFIFIFGFEGIIFTSPASADVIRAKNLITNISYSISNKTYEVTSANTGQRNAYDVTASTGDCNFESGNPGTATNNVDWGTRMSLTSHFGGNQTYLENIPVNDYGGLASQVGRKSDWNGSFGQWVPSGQSWRKTGVGVGRYGSQSVNFPTPVTLGGGPKSFQITIRMCRGDDGSWINATGTYVANATNSLSVTPTSASLQAQIGTVATGNAKITLQGFVPSAIDFTSNVAETTSDYTLTLPERFIPNDTGKSFNTAFQFEYRVVGKKPGNYVVPVNITATYP